MIWFPQLKLYLYLESVYGTDALAVLSIAAPFAFVHLVSGIAANACWIAEETELYI